jgi:TRAP transporter 4TM/12TM fusion protein
MIELDEILAYRTSIPAPTDLIIGGMIIGILLVGNWLIFGKTLTIVSIGAIVYLILGRYMPQPLTVPPVPYERLLMWLSVELGTGKGVYGDILDLSATYLFLFIFFGGVLDAFGGTRFIIGVGKWVGSKLRAGPAMTALVGSSLLGSVTGSTAANVTITGSFTIPMMKRSGYTPEQAAAIETVSSNGGQIIPPIMGATAFLMAGFANIPYIEIVKAAIIPTLLYIFCVFLYIHLSAQKMEVKTTSDVEVSGKSLLLDSPIFFIPLGVLIFLLIKGFTLPFVGFWSIVAIVVVGSITGWVRKDVSFIPIHVTDRVIEGIRSASEMAMMTGLLGIIVSAIITSGIGIKLPMAIEDISHGYLLIALVIAMISSILLGMGVPTPSAYVLVAIGAVPVLLAMGVPRLSAHLFAFVFAISSHITPPVAVGLLVASKMAGSDYWKSAKEAFKAAFVTFILPYLFIYAPGIILLPQANITVYVIQIIGSAFGIISFQFFLSRYCLTPLNYTESAGFLVSSILIFTSVFKGNSLLFAAGVFLFVVLVISQFGKKKIEKLRMNNAR